MDLKEIKEAMILGGMINIADEKDAFIREVEYEIPFFKIYITFSGILIWTKQVYSYDSGLEDEGTVESLEFELEIICEKDGVDYTPTEEEELFIADNFADQIYYG